MGDTCVSSVTITDATINQLKCNESLKTIYCLRVFVVYKDEML